MPFVSEFTIEAGPGNTQPWTPRERRGYKLAPSGVGLTHTYETDIKLLAEADWVYLQVVCCAYQIHPATVAELAALGPVGGANAARWTIEGPLLHLPGDPGEATNCTISVEVTHSLTADPGSNWIRYKPGRYRLRSVKARVTVTRPSTAYSFRITKLGILATRLATAQRPRRVQDGVADVIPAGMCRIVSHDFELLGTLDVEDDAFLEILT